MYNIVTIALAVGAGKAWGINILRIRVPMTVTLMAVISVIVLHSMFWLQRSLRLTK